MTPSRSAEALLDRLDRAPVGAFHRRLLLVSGLGWMFDAMDILMLGAVVAAVSAVWVISGSFVEGDRRGGL